MAQSINNIKFNHKIIVLGCGFIGQGILPLIFNHIDIHPEKLLIITGDERGLAVAQSYNVRFIIKNLTLENYEQILDMYVSPGDFIVNLTTDVGTSWMVDFCQKRSLLYLDTGLSSAVNRSTNALLPISQRSIAWLRHKILFDGSIKKEGPTAVLAHGANPGIVSHLVKKALLNIAEDEGRNIAPPKNREDWAKLSQALGIKTIHIAERDTQIGSQNKVPGEFVNTWSIDGFLCEAIGPSELGWGTHEKYFPGDGEYHDFGDKSCIYLKKPGACVRIRTWLPLSGPQIGFLIPHNEALSISSYFSIGSGTQVQYRPTVHYCYHPCDDAILSLIELHENNWKTLEHSAHSLNSHEIVSGIDELGVLLMGHKKGAYWFGSRLGIEEAKKLAPYNSATTLQVTAGVISGMLWAIRHPDQGPIEAEQMDFNEVMEVAGIYWGQLVGEYSDWSPILGRNDLFPEDIDSNDPWQFKNFRVL